MQPLLCEVNLTGMWGGLTKKGSAWTIMGFLGSEEGENVKDIGASGADCTPNKKCVDVFAL